MLCIAIVTFITFMCSYSSLLVHTEVHSTTLMHSPSCTSLLHFKVTQPLTELNLARHLDLKYTSNIPGLPDLQSFWMISTCPQGFCGLSVGSKEFKKFRFFISVFSDPSWMNWRLSGVCLTALLKLSAVQVVPCRSHLSFLTKKRVHNTH